MSKWERDVAGSLMNFKIQRWCTVCVTSDCVTKVRNAHAADVQRQGQGWMAERKNADDQLLDVVLPPSRSEKNDQRSRWTMAALER